MKKAGAIAILFIYLLCSGGFTLHAHYCGGSLADISLSRSQDGGCCGKVPMKKGCCQDREIRIEKTDSHLSGAFSFDITDIEKMTGFIPAVWLSHIGIEAGRIPVFVFYNSFHPPDGKLFLRIRVLRI